MAKAAAPSRAERTQDVAVAERPASQRADLHGGTLHNPQPPSQPDADAGVEVPSHAAIEADDSWQLCPLTKVCEA